MTAVEVVAPKKFGMALSQNQKMIGLLVTVGLLFFFAEWSWIIGLGVVVVLILFRDPLWDLAQWARNALFPVKKPDPIVPPIAEQPIPPTETVVVVKKKRVKAR